nr:MAG TPA: Group XII secretory phospholipase A2 precursor (PLA2G12) [Caudoviricetes sp.]
MTVGVKRMVSITKPSSHPSMSNGCGCQTGLFRYIKPPYARMFHLPCCIHDDAYEIGGDKHSRRMADRELFRRCTVVVCRNEHNPWRMMWLFTIAMTYYIAVRIFGFIYFKFNDK